MKRLFLSLIPILAASFVLFYRPDTKHTDHETLTAKHEASLPRPAESSTIIAPGTEAQIQQSIAAMEYNIHWQADKNAYSSPNRNNNLRITYHDDGFSIQPRVDSTAIWQQTYKVQGIFRNEQQVIALSPAPDVVATDNQLLQHFDDGLHIEYRNTPEGMRQNFVVDERPAGEGNLRLRLETSGDLQPMLQDSGTVALVSADGVQAYYEDLKVFDATGARVSAWMEVTEATLDEATGEWVGGVDLVVRDFGVRFPILVDPVSVVPGAVLAGDSASYFGYKATTAGDLNDDGYGDVIVGAPYYDAGLGTEGAAFVYYGSANGIDSLSRTTLLCHQVNAEMGISVSSAGDLNGDGFGDVIVGVPGYSGDSIYEGAVFVFFGKSGGIDSIPNMIITSDQSFSGFGWSVALAGDVNGDHISDFLVGAPWYSHGQTDEGVVFLYNGGFCYQDSVFNGCIDCPIDQGPPVPDQIAVDSSFCMSTLFEMDSANAGFGYYVEPAGDINADGYSDWIVRSWDGTFFSSSFYLYYGDQDSVAAPTLISHAANVLEYGNTVVPAGDVDGDGFCDIAISRTSGPNALPTGYIFYGCTAGIDTSRTDILARLSSSDSNNSIQIKQTMPLTAGRTFSAQYIVGLGGDLNGDGFSDLMVGRVVPFDSIEDRQGILVYFGSNRGIDTIAAETIWVSTGSVYLSMEPAGDINGDGYSDVIIGATLDRVSFNDDEGAAYIFYGHPTGIDSSYTLQYAESQIPSAEMGTSVACAGDVNGDGFSDFIAGAPLYDNGAGAIGAAMLYLGDSAGVDLQNPIVYPGLQPNAAFGTTVSSAGDVNGDGFSDFVVGAPFYDGQVGPNNGSISLYYGRATNLSTISPLRWESNMPGAKLGRSVASAGDLNGDGFSDIIGGAWGYTNGEQDEGAIFVYYGSPTGIDTNGPFILQGEDTGARLGWSVAAAGDVNGDGYSDLIAGAFTYNAGNGSEGAGFLYYGSPCGVSLTADVILRGNQPDAQFGYSVASAGDINADGFGDLVIGANGYDIPETDEGAAFVFLGSAVGVNPTPIAILDADQPGAAMGYSVSSAGDANGDGYGELIVGAANFDGLGTENGRCFVYHGNPDGLDTIPATILNCDSSTAHLGSAVASAGDLDGDGYSDLIAGARTYSDGQQNEGAAFIYYGNGGAGTPILPQQFQPNSNDTTVGPGGGTNASGRIDLAMIGRSPLGRIKGKMIWEVRPAGIPFDTADNGRITNCVDTFGITASYVDLINTDSISTQLVTHLIGLNDSLKYNWRCRVRYDPVTAITGQMYSPWYYYKSRTPEVPTLGFKTGPLPPREIEVFGNVRPISNNDLLPDTLDNTDFGDAMPCIGSIVKTFYIHNRGNSSLGVDHAALSGANGVTFSITQQPNTSIPPGDSTSIQVTFAPSVLGAYTDMVSIYNNDCDEAIYTFAIQGSASPDIVPPAITYCPNDTIACTGALTWRRPTYSDNCSIAQLDSNYVFNGTFPVGETTIQFTATDSSQNDSSCSFKVIVKPIPTPSIAPGPDPSACYGSTLVLDAGSGYMQYAWSDSNATQRDTLIVVQTRAYQVSVTDAFGCVGSTGTTVTMNPLPTPQIVLEKGTFHTTVEYTTYQWRMNDADLPGRTEAQIGPQLPGWYSVYVVDSNGCGGISDSIRFNPQCPNGASNCLVIVPNPAIDSLNLMAISPIPSSVLLRYEIKNIIGQTVMAGQMNGLERKYPIDVTQISEGHYVIYVTVLENGEQWRQGLRFLVWRPK